MKAIVFILAACAALAVASGWMVSQPHPRFSEAQWQKLEKPGYASAGRRIFFAGGCDSCHAIPGQPDPLRLGGGMELKTPGADSVIRVAGNIGRMERAERPPSRSYQCAAVRRIATRPASLSRVSLHVLSTHEPGDIADLLAFLRTLPAIQDRAPAHRLAFPFSIRRALGLWKLMYFDDTSLQPDANQSAQRNLGRYLVEGPGHCGECHTPRGLVGQMEPNQYLPFQVTTFAA